MTENIVKTEGEDQTENLVKTEPEQEAPATEGLMGAVKRKAAELVSGTGSKEGEEEAPAEAKAPKKEAKKAAKKEALDPKDPKKAAKKEASDTARPIAKEKPGQPVYQLVGMPSEGTRSISTTRSIFALNDTFTEKQFGSPAVFEKMVAQKLIRRYKDGS